MSQFSNIETMKMACVWLGLSSVHSYLKKNARVRNAFIFLPILIQIFIISVEFFISISYQSEMFHQGSIISALTDALQVVGILLTSTIQIIENLFKGQLDTQIQKTMNEIDCEIIKNHWCTVHCSTCKRLNLRKFFMTKFLYLIMFGLCIDVIIITTIRDDEKSWRQNICARGWSNNMIRIGLLQIIMHFGWITT